MICSAKRLRLYSIAFISHLFVVVDLVELADAGEDIVHALERLLDGSDLEYFFGKWKDLPNFFPLQRFNSQGIQDLFMCKSLGGVL